MIKYVIFDKDGTLLDTEPFFEGSWVKVGAKWGLPDTDTNYFDNIAGKSITKAIDFLRETYEGINAEVFMEERLQMVWKMMEEGIPLKEGCLEILDFLRAQGIKIAIATSTTKARALKNLTNLGLTDKYDALVTGDMVSNGKPAPDIFLEAGRLIGADPTETVVVGDSSADMIGGHRAGMRPVMVIDSGLPSDEAEPLCFAICHSLFEVIDLIKRENGIK